VLAGLRQIGRDAKLGEPNHVLIVGIDGTPLALQRIRQGTEDATINQDPFKMGALAISSAVDVLNGKAVEKEQLLPPMLVTKANVDDPQLWGNRFKP
jgi:ribose transport system substrate-binding protein